MLRVGLQNLEKLSLGLTEVGMSLLLLCKERGRGFAQCENWCLKRRVGLKIREGSASGVDDKKDCRVNTDHFGCGRVPTTER